MNGPFKFLFLFGTLFFGLNTFLLAQTQPSPPPEDPAWRDITQSDLDFLNKNGYRMDSGLVDKMVHKNWRKYYDLTRFIPIYENTVNEIERVMCDTTKQNRSILVVGTPGEAYKYIFSRFVARAEEKGRKDPSYKCGMRFDYELNLGKMEYPKVGETDEHYQQIIDAASYKSVFIYISDLRTLIGKGTHSNSSIGIESAYARSISTGELYSVAFIDKYRYQEVLNSPNAYVIDAFAKVIQVNEPQKEELIPFLNNYIAKSPLKIPDNQYKYIMNLGKKYQPSYFEPDRTLKVLDSILRGDKIPSSISQEDLRKITLTAFGLPLWLINKDYSRLNTLKQTLDKKVVGAEDVSAPLVEAIQSGYIVGKADGRPIATSLFVGPTGLGKSYLPKKLAEALSVDLYVYDMTQYQNSYTADSFVDAISSKLLSNPYSVFLLEEIDKSSTEVLDKLYFLLDEGVFYGRGQRPISASGAIFLLTTNAGEFTVIDNAKNPNLPSIVMDDLQRKFRPSFLNRFDTIGIFKPFSSDNFMKLARVMVDEQIAYIKDMLGYNLELTDKVYTYLGVNGQSKTFGARPMKRLIEKVILSGLSKYQLLNGNIADGAQILIDFDGKTFILKVSGQKPFTYEVNPENNNGD
ncbi:MAG: AAA family ATPase [Bacteriovoracaceae bacterium]